MPPSVAAFTIVWVLALMLWVAGLACYVRARRHYIGPKGLLASMLPIGRLRPSNYTTQGVAILRWQFIFMLAFLVLIAVGFTIATTQFDGLPK